MARFWAQLFTPVFFLVTVVGVILTVADKGWDIDPGGNLGNLSLHLTWSRNILDAAVLGVCIWVGFLASRRVGRIATIAVGAALLALGVAGFLIGDDAAASKGFAGMHFPTAVNVFDLVAGLLGVLAGLGTIDDEAEAAG
jgi:hypothetical protein